MHGTGLRRAHQDPSRAQSHGMQLSQQLRMCAVRVRPYSVDAALCVPGLGRDLYRTAPSRPRRLYTVFYITHASSACSAAPPPLHGMHRRSTTTRIPPALGSSLVCARKSAVSRHVRGQARRTYWTAASTQRPRTSAFACHDGRVGEWFCGGNVSGALARMLRMDLPTPPPDCLRPSARTARKGTLPVLDYESISRRRAHGTARHAPVARRRWRASARTM